MYHQYQKYNTMTVYFSRLSFQLASKRYTNNRH